MNEHAIIGGRYTGFTGQKQPWRHAVQTPESPGYERDQRRSHRAIVLFWHTYSFWERWSPRPQSPWSRFQQRTLLCLSSLNLFQLVLAYSLSRNTIESAEISRNKPQTGSAEHLSPDGC